MIVDLPLAVQAGIDNARRGFWGEAFGRSGHIARFAALARAWKGRGVSRCVS